MYKRHTMGGLVIRLSDGVQFPESEDCHAYLEYKAWIAEGNTPEPAEAPAVTPLQEIAALEVANPITHRKLRDLALAVGDIASAITGKPKEENPAIREILGLEGAIEALREQAKEQGLIP